jgi:polyphosphate kinase 2 (PPK2 family)
MEENLFHSGAIILKFWMQIDKDEQERRFRERMNNPAKQWKITDEDWRNREKWDQYETAVDDMIRYTSTDFAPWHIIEGNNKYYARVRALQIINDMIEKRLEGIED